MTYMQKQNFDALKRSKYVYKAHYIVNGSKLVSEFFLLPFPLIPHGLSNKTFNFIAILHLKNKKC